MKLISFKYKNQSSYGLITKDGVVDYFKRYPEIPNLRELLSRNKLKKIFNNTKNCDADYSLKEISFLPPITNPEKIICIGVNYGKRNAEYKDGSEQPKYPSVFMRSRESLVGHQEPILDPLESNQLDYEGEIVIVIGREGRRIKEKDAYKYIAGLTIMNEGSVRDFLRHAKFNVTQGKNFEKSGALGPWIVTPDELDPMSKLQVITKVNNEIRQNDTTDNLMFSFKYLLSYLSTFYRLKPGDIIATGTPSGAGARFNPPKYLKSKDLVEVEVPGIGVLRNRIKSEKTNA